MMTNHVGFVLWLCVCGLCPHLVNTAHNHSLSLTESGLENSERQLNGTNSHKTRISPKHIVLKLNRLHSSTAHRLSFSRDSSRWASLHLTGSVKWTAFPFFSTTITLGHDPSSYQQLGLVVDTGSADLLVAGPDREGRGVARRWYDPLKSSTARQLPNATFSMRYEQGDAEGLLYREHLLLGDDMHESIEQGLSFDIGVVNKSHGLFDWEKFEGVLGLGRSQATSAGQTSFLDELVWNRRIENVFGMLLCDETVSTCNETAAEQQHCQSQLVLGAIPDNLFRGEMKWTSMYGTDYYTVKLVAIKLNGHALSGVTCEDYNSPGWTIVDSGTTSITLASPIYKAFKARIKSLAGLPDSWLIERFFEQRACLPIEDISAFPELTFAFPDANRRGEFFDVSVPSFMYLQHESDANGVPCYLMNIMEDCNQATGVVLGMTFMQAVFVSFNRSEMIIGFGTSSCKLRKHFDLTVSNSYVSLLSQDSCTPNMSKICDHTPNFNAVSNQYSYLLVFLFVFVFSSMVVASALLRTLHTVHRKIFHPRLGLMQKLVRNRSESLWHDSELERQVEIARCKSEFTIRDSQKLNELATLMAESYNDTPRTCLSRNSSPSSIALRLSPNIRSEGMISPQLQFHRSVSR